MRTADVADPQFIILALGQLLKAWMRSRSEPTKYDIGGVSAGRSQKRKAVALCSGKFVRSNQILNYTLREPANGLAAFLRTRAER